MKYPDFLKKSETIGFVAPSFGCSIEPYRTAFQNACRKFEAMGYELDIGPNCFASCGIGISNTPQKCGEELTEYYQSSNNQALISCGGGELMCEILDYVDFEALKTAKPKWYMGYSDNTNFTFLLATLLDTASIYGPSAPAFGMEPWHPAIQDAMLTLTGEKQKMTGYPFWEKESQKDESHPLEPYHVTEPRLLRTYIPGCSAEFEYPENTAEQNIIMPGCNMEQCANLEGTNTDNNGGLNTDDLKHNKIMSTNIVNVTGRLLGGCMDCLVNLLGTRYDKVADFNKKYAEDGILWFLEACDLNVMAIRRAIWQMDHAGWFENTRGFLIGRPLNHGQELMGLDQYHAVIDLLAKYNVPIIMDADLGHLPPMMPIICGSKASLQVHGNDLALDMQFI